MSRILCTTSARVPRRTCNLTSKNFVCFWNSHTHDFDFSIKRRMFNPVIQTTALQRVVNITGATAFRAAANTSIIALLGGAGTTEYTFDTTTGASAGATNRAIYRGTVAGIPGTVIVYEQRFGCKLIHISHQLWPCIVQV